MKKITICSPQLGISPESNSGGEVYDREVIKHLCKTGISSLVYLPKKRPYPKISGLQVFHAPIKTMFPPYIFNFFVFPFLLKAYKNYHFDILRVHSPYFVGPAALLFKHFHPSVPLVASYLHLEEKSLFQSLIDKFIIKKFNHIITISNFTKKEIKKRYKVSSKKISVAYPGIEEKFKPQEKSSYLISKYNLKNKKILLFLGGLKQRKNPLFLLDVFRKINDKQVVLLIAGDGPLKNKLIQKAENLGLADRVILTGFVPEENKVKFYNLADIVLFPTLKEGFGMIAAEAGACGKPVIASDNSSLPEIIKNNKTGFLAETNNINDWVSKTKILLKNKGLRKLMGQRAIKYVRDKFSWQKNAKEHIKVFDLPSRRGSPSGRVIL